MKCKICNGTGVMAQKTYDGWEPLPCDCGIDPRDLGEE